LTLTATACGSGTIGIDGSGTVKVDYAVKGGEMTMAAWAKIAEGTGGVTFESKGSADMAGLVGQAMKADLQSGIPVDIVFVVDTTGSMQDDIDAVKAKLSELVDALAATNPDYQCGVVAYRDRGDTYLTQVAQPLTNDKAKIQTGIASLKADEGGDFREHAYAGIDTGLQEAWRPKAAHRIILIGDAPPHEGYTDDPRNFTNDIALAKNKDVKINAIGVYCDTACQLLVSALDSATGGTP
jgi:hypothetical protein